MFLRVIPLNCISKNSSKHTCLRGVVGCFGCFLYLAKNSVRIKGKDQICLRSTKESPMFSVYTSIILRNSVEHPLGYS